MEKESTFFKELKICVKATLLCMFILPVICLIVGMVIIHNSEEYKKSYEDCENSVCNFPI